jgi:pyruvate dehydrogenase E2 component (dihydrolipoamide acetyltransferase)
MPFSIYMPKLSPTMTEGTVAKWHKHIGDRVEAGDVLLEIATDKATVEHAALDEGWLRAIVCDDGQKASVGDPLAVFSQKPEESIEGYTPKALGGEVKKEAPKEEKPAIAPQAVTAQGERVLASPLARKLASEQQIDLRGIQGSGPGGRIMSRDLKEQPPAQRAAAAKVIEEVMTPMRKTIAKRLQESKSLIPHFYIRQEVDAEAIVSMREELKKNDLSFTVNDFIIKACGNALAKHPEVNSGFQESSQKILRFPRVDISVAVTIQGGLITPIVTDVPNKTLSSLSKEVKALATRAREGKLKREEYEGGSFTISNLGMFGISEMIPIVNPPQGAILGIGAIMDTPVVKNGLVAAGKKMVLTLSCDHRIIDGAEAAQFMRTLKQLLENPLLFLT